MWCYADIGKILSAHNNHNGSTFTLCPLKNMKGRAFIAVGIFPERTHPITSFDGELTTDKVINFVWSNLDLLGHRNVALGTWYDSEYHRIVLDVVLLVPRKHRERAIELGKKFNQHSIYDLKADAAIPTGGTGECTGTLTSIEAQARLEESL